mgnify:FL=1
MKCFSVHNIDNQSQIQEELLNQIKETRPSIFTEDITHKVVTVSVNSTASTAILKNFEDKLSESFGSLLNKTFWITGPKGTNRPHIDGTSQFLPKIKLMIPVLNCQGTYTSWFNYSGGREHIKTDTGLEYFVPRDYDRLNSIATTTLTDAMWARVDIFHSVFNPRNSTRIICSYVFENQDKLIELLA